jgi:hypothetical protein
LGRRWVDGHGGRPVEQAGEVAVDEAAQRVGGVAAVAAQLVWVPAGFGVEQDGRHPAPSNRTPQH